MKAPELTRMTTAAAERLDVERIRADFPILRTEMNGRPLVYLDSSATSQKPLSVLQAMEDYYRRYNANIHRGIYAIAEEATQAYETARDRVQRLVNARSRKEIVFTRNTTEAINLVAHAWGRRNIDAGDRVLLTEMEHHSNLVPWQILAAETGAILDFIPLDGQGRLDLSDLDRRLQGVKLVGLTQLSNVLGTVNPVAEIAARAHAHGALALVDGAQSVPHLPVDVQALDCDFLAFSAHKMLGPTGIGVLYGKRAILEAMDPFLGGGEMIHEVRLDASTYKELPWKFEAGTMPIAEAIGLGAAVDYLQAAGLEAIHRHDQELVALALERLASEVPGLRLHGPPAPEHGAAVAFTLEGIHAHDLASILDAEGIAIRAGHHCTMPLHERLGVAATARASFYLYNTSSEVEALIGGLHRAREVFRL